MWPLAGLRPPPATAGAAGPLHTALHRLLQQHPRWCQWSTATEAAISPEYSCTSGHCSQEIRSHDAHSTPIALATSTPANYLQAFVIFRYGAGVALWVVLPPSTPISYVVEIVLLLSVDSLIPIVTTMPRSIGLRRVSNL